MLDAWSASAQARSFIPRLGITRSPSPFRSHATAEAGAAGAPRDHRFMPISGDQAAFRPASRPGAPLAGDHDRRRTCVAKAPHHLTQPRSDLLDLHPRDVRGDRRDALRPSRSASMHTMRAKRAPASGRLRPRPSGVSHV